MKMMKKLARNLGYALVLGLTLPAPGATTTVLVGSGGLVFVPATATIAQHDSVIWSWSGGPHSTTSGTTSGSTASPNGLWDSSLNSPPHSFTNTFNSAGTFPYYCSVPFHFENGMKGTIVVTAANNPPTVTLTNPPSGSTLSAPASIILAANAADSDGTVTNVQFFQGTTLLGHLTSPPFSLAVNNLAAANYTFSAVATDNGGLSATDSITLNVITATPVTITPQLAAKANFGFSYNPDIGLQYVIQRSTNLAAGNWLSLVTNTAASSPVNFTDPNPVPGGAFYRVGHLPNP
jgi:plastocyanin